jgi:predicted lipoprotein with Yx(FWY)xxD motif
MRRIPKLVPPAVIVGTALLTAACSSGADNPAVASGAGKPAGASTAAPDYSDSAPSGQSTGATVDVAGSPLGQLLVDGSGRTLYLFELDKGTSSTCDGPCAQAWPPLLTTGAPSAGTGTNAADLGTTTRKDGKTEVTYHGHPLYYYAGDSKPGATTGQGLNQFGAKWYVLAPSGDKIDNS